MEVSLEVSPEVSRNLVKNGASGSVAVRYRGTTAACIRFCFFSMSLSLPKTKERDSFGVCTETNAGILLLKSGAGRSLKATGRERKGLVKPEYSVPSFTG